MKINGLFGIIEIRRLVKKNAVLKARLRKAGKEYIETNPGGDPMLMLIKKCRRELGVLPGDSRKIVEKWFGANLQKLGNRAWRKKHIKEVA